MTVKRVMRSAVVCRAVVVFVLAWCHVLPAFAQSSVQVIASGLDNPRDLRFGPDGALYVIEAGRGGGASSLCLPSAETGAPACYGPTGAVTRIVAAGVHQRVVSGLPSLAPAGGNGATGPTDFDFGFDHAWITVGLGANPADRAAFAAAGIGLGMLVRVNFFGQWDYALDIASHEAAFNPDGAAVESNPYSIRVLRDRALIADAGANAVLQIDLTGQVSTLAVFAPRSVTGPSGAAVMMQSVPTVVTDGPDGFIYIGELTGFPFPVGAARVLRMRRDGLGLTPVATGFTNIIDIAFDQAGGMWVLEHDADGLLGAGAEGRLVRVLNGQQQVITGGLVKPGGMAIGLDGAIYVTNRSTLAGAGEVLRILP